MRRDRKTEVNKVWERDRQGEREIKCERETDREKIRYERETDRDKIKYERETGRERNKVWERDRQEVEISYARETKTGCLVVLVLGWSGEVTLSNSFYLFSEADWGWWVWDSCPKLVYSFTHTLTTPLHQPLNQQGWGRVCKSALAVP